MDKIFKVIVTVFCTTWMLLEVVLPASTAIFLSNRYMDYAKECEIAMETSWYMSQQGNNDKTEIIQMLTCHEYDKTRKLMLTSGLSESYLSWLGLKSLELDQRSAEEYVEAHRFTER